MKLDVYRKVFSSQRKAVSVDTAETSTGTGRLFHVCEVAILSPKTDHCMGETMNVIMLKERRQV